MSPLINSEPRTYRGVNLEQLLPQIRTELGPDAVVLRQRDGLSGGIAGFFQKRCVEVVARPGAPRLDAYDADSDSDSDAGVEQDEPRFERVATPGPRATLAPAPFAAQLAHAEVVTAPLVDAVLLETAPAPEDAPAPDHAPAPAPLTPLAPLTPRPLTTRERALAGSGLAGALSPALAAELISETISHALPFAQPRALKALLRAGLARRIPLAPPPGPGGRTIVFVGADAAGKTRAAGQLASAYASRSDLDVRLITLCAPDDGERLQTLVAPAGVAVEPIATITAPAGADRTLTIVDTPAVSPAAEAFVSALALELERLGDHDVHVIVPATLDAAAVRRLLDGLAPLRPYAMAITRLDEVAHAGPAIEEAIAAGLGISYCADADGLAPADPTALAQALLP